MVNAMAVESASQLAKSKSTEDEWLQRLAVGPDRSMQREWICKASRLPSSHGDAAADALLSELDEHMRSRMYIADNELSVADVAVLAAVYSRMSKPGWTDESRLRLADAWRWFDLVQHQPPLTEAGVYAVLNLNRDVPAELVDRVEAEPKGQALPSNTDEDAATKAAAAAAKKAAKKEAKKADKKAKQDDPAAAAAAGTAAQSARAEEDLSITRLDFRVGRILSAQNHPDADSLYVEQIDIGEEKPRTVCSGLRKYIASAEELIGLCVVLCNLKPVKMRGVVSEAMVMCATSADKETVELVKPPAESSVGTRIHFAEQSGDPDAVLNPKKQVFEKIAPELRTNENCVACWKTTPFETPLGVCTVPSVANGDVK